ncbi:hypothetical protein QE374_003136 [Microbacterium sp. SORGH_AS428]|nr:hypothetical protein [Microbacterium sp. SORGH_AS_0428]
MVEHAEGQGLEDHGLEEAALDGQHRRAGEVQLALAVAGDRPGEAEIREGRERDRIHHAVVAQVPQLIVAEAELAQQGQQATGSRDHAEASPSRQTPGEQLEDRGPGGGAVAQRRLDHGQFVAVGEQRGRLGHGGHSIERG